jgi:hypothetical protein
MWLGESADQRENSRRASRLSVSWAGRPSQIDILTIWLEISLVREFKESCSFAPKVWTYASEVGTGTDEEEEEGEEEKSEGMKGRKEPAAPLTSSDIPFRRDNVECLFIL